MSVAAAHAFLDRYMEKAAALSAKNGRPVRCAGPGCFACCREQVYAEKREAIWLVNSLPMEAMLRVRERTIVWWKIFFEHGLNLMPYPREDSGNFATLFRYRQALAWCPVLEEGQCSGYASRPAGCRLHAVVGSPKRCEDDEKRRTQKFMSTDQQPNVVTYANGLMCENAPMALFEYDHLGIWLGHLLLGHTERSRAARDCMIKQSDPQDMIAS